MVEHDLKIGVAVAVDVALDDGRVVLAAQLIDFDFVQFAFGVGEGCCADEVELVVLGRTFDGINRREIDLVVLMLEVSDGVPRRRFGTAVFDRCVDEDIVASTSLKHVAPQTAVEPVETSAADDVISACAAAQAVAEIVGGQDIGRGIAREIFGRAGQLAIF